MVAELEVYFYEKWYYCFMSDSIYDMVRQELVDGGEKFKDLSSVQKDFVAGELTNLILLAGPELPLNFEEAGKKLDELYTRTLVIGE